jgi:hypothetical protein
VPEPTEVVLATQRPTTFADLNDRSWAKVAKSPDDYIGQGYRLWACVTQFDSATGSDTFRADAANKNLKDEYWLDGVNVLFTGASSELSDVVEDDVVQVNVLVLGSLNYDTQIGGETTVPLFEVLHISHKGSCK